MDEVEGTPVASVGERLRTAREEKGISLEDIAAQTRIPRRHLESLENSDWEHLPAPTYTIGFARSYASSVGLDRTEISDQLRSELGGQRPVTTTAEIFEPADPARTMPKWLVFGAIAAVIALVVVMSWLNKRSLEEPDAASNEPVATASAPATPSAPPAAAPAPTAQGPVVLTATAPSWIQVTDQGKTLFSGELAPGQRFEVPATATAPLLKAGKPETLQVTVGGATAPPVGPPGRVASNVSLLGPDLMRAPSAGPSVAPGAPPAVDARPN
jgi:cytoskeletal protein RodZ